MKHMIKLSPFFLLSLFAPVLLCAQKTDKMLNLREAIQLSLSNSKTLKMSSSKVEQAIAMQDEAKNNQLPDLKVSGAYLYLMQPKINIKLGGGSNNSDSSSSGSSFPNVHQALYGILSASMPLYAGGKITNGIKSAEYLAEAAKLDVQNDKEKVIQNTVDAYYNLYKANAAVKLVTENLHTSQQRTKDFTNLEANGIIARNDLMKAELQQSNVELTLLDAQNNLKIANFNFDLMLGLSDSTNILIDSSDILPEPDVQSVAALESMALSNRFDYLALLQRQKAASYNTKIVKGDALPTVALTGGYIAADIPNALSAYNVVNVGVGVSYNIGSLYKNKAKVRQAKTQEKILQIQQQQMDDDIRTQIFQAYNDYLHSVKKIDVYKSAISQAQENYRITKNKYDNSLATATDLLDADVALLQSKIDFEYARADAAVSYNKIYETVGLLNKKLNNVN